MNENITLADREPGDSEACFEANTLETTYAVATLGSKTKRGGEIVSASSGMTVDDHRVALVGDTVQYPDGTQSTIVSGAGYSLTYKRRPAAIVGSELENGDTVVDSLQSLLIVQESADTPIPGLLQAGYLAPEHPAE